ncbi:unnamed protein product, partial [Coregonus sp. 'balchen']
PTVTCEVEGVTHQFLVDTGCTYSAIRSHQPLSSESIQVVGVSGTPEAQYKTNPLLFQWGPSKLKHQFLFCPNCPINLLGRDLLCRLGCAIYLTEKGVEVSVSQIPSARVLMLPILPTPIPSTTQEIYWLRCLPTGPATPAVQFQFNQMRKLIYSFYPYKPPQTDLHCTLNVTDDEETPYTQDWDENMMHLTPTIRCVTIICGTEGVAAPVILSNNLKPWYQLGPDSAPHSLAVGNGHEARSLGQMIKRASKLTWETTTTPGLLKATTEKMWRLTTVDTEEQCQPERITLPRHHGKPYSDHPSSPAVLESIDKSIWTHTPFDKKAWHTPARKEQLRNSS